MIELLWNGPVSEAKMSRCIEALGLPAGRGVLDVGRGCGEVLLRLYERYQIQGTGIDSSPEHIAEAKRRAESRISGSAVHFLEADATSFPVDPGSLDLAVCLGATHAFGLGGDAYRSAIGRMVPVVAPGGSLLVADGYMAGPA